MTAIATTRRLLAAAERAVNAWYDRERDGRAIWIFLALFVAIWTVFHIIANVSIDVHPDLAEVYAWSRHPSAGYYKHPPLAAFMAAAWFGVFPAADWAFYLLAMANAALALFAVDLIARRYLSGDKRLFVLLLLLLTPFYQFFAERFSTNQTLLSTWPLATYCFLRAFESRAVLWSAAAGAAAALAMLGKYYSIYLILSFVVAALAHPARWTYLKSPAPWISVAVGGLVLAPHIHWLVTTGFQPFDYAFDVHGNRSLLRVFEKIGTYLIGALAYVAGLIGVYLLAVRPDRRTLAEAIWPSDPDRRMLVLLLAAQLLLPALSAPFLGVLLTSLWTMQAWFLLPICLLAPDTAVLSRRAASSVALLVCAITVTVLLAAPAVAWVHHAAGTRQARGYLSAAAEELTRAWHRSTDRPLRIVLGEADLAAAASFYSADHPDSVPIVWLWAFPWVSEDRLAREGWAALCPLGDRLCIDEADRRGATAPRAQRLETEIAPRFLGVARKPRQFVIWIAPPRDPTSGLSK